MKLFQATGVPHYTQNILNLDRDIREENCGGHRLHQHGWVKSPKVVLPLGMDHEHVCQLMLDDSLICTKRYPDGSVQLRDNYCGERMFFSSP